MRLLDLAEAIVPSSQIEEIGIRPGEKLHEVLISGDEARNTLELDGMYVIQPDHPWWKRENWARGQALAEGFRYASDTNSQWLTKRQLSELVEAEESQMADRLHSMS